VTENCELIRANQIGAEEHNLAINAALWCTSHVSKWKRNNSKV